MASAEPTHPASIASPSDGPLDSLFGMLFGDDDETSSSTPDPDDETSGATTAAPV
ncbi:hypothetical protein I4I78_28875, partial [Pseudonocardia sp. KRD-291]|nr:hypothetical protein [Pseudonocardia sp. KRD291]